MVNFSKLYSRGIVGLKKNNEQEYEDYFEFAEFLANDLVDKYNKLIVDFEIMLKSYGLEKGFLLINPLEIESDDERIKFLRKSGSLVEGLKGSSCLFPVENIIWSRMALYIVSTGIKKKDHNHVLSGLMFLQQLYLEITSFPLDPNEEVQGVPAFQNIDSILLDYAKRYYAKENANKRLENDPIQLAKAEIEQEYWEQKDQFKRRGYSAEFTRKMHIKYPVITDIKTIERLVSKLNKENDDYPSS